MDLVDISNLGIQFDVVECSGVIHHMEKPAHGLAKLVQQLKPGGYIKLGLYSEIARKLIVDARNIIQALGETSTPESIRKFRRSVMDGKIDMLSDLPRLYRDFYSLSECRDLCFHVQEHRYSTKMLKALLNEQNLIFCGFSLPNHITSLYSKQYSSDINMTSLENWGKFEEEYPSTFTGMYQFWAYKAG